MEPASDIDHESLPVRWGFGDVAIGFVAAYLLTILFSPLVFAATGVDANTPSDQVPIKTVALQQIPFYAGFLGAVLYAAYRKGNGLVRDFHFAMKPRDVLGVLAGVATQWAALLLYVPLIWWDVINADEVSKPARDLTDKAQGTTGVVLLILVVVVAAPIVEELFFRGLVLRVFERRWGTKWAVVGSSLVFAAAHFEPLQFPALFLFGLVAAFLAVRTQRLGAGMWAHLAFNGLAVISLLNSR